MTGTEGPLPRVSRPGLLFALAGIAGLVLPLVEFKANRIVGGEALPLAAALPLGGVATAALATILLAGVAGRLPNGLRLALALAGVLAVPLALGLAAAALVPEGNRIARAAPGAGFWVLFLAFALMAADALTRIGPTLGQRWALLAAAVLVTLGLVGSGWLDRTSVMTEHAARAAQFGRAAGQHLVLAFGSLGAALAIGLPLGLLLHQRVALRGWVLGLLNMLQTIPSLALFGIMIPLFGWVAANVPGAAAAGVAGIGIFPALVALFLYSLLPVVSNTVVGLRGVDPAVREAALGLGMTRAGMLVRVQLPLALPVILAAVRIVLVQNIGMAVIAGLIGGGGFGTFVFQGLNQTAMDLILLGALPTIFLALVAGVALDLLVETLDPIRRRSVA